MLELVFAPCSPIAGGRVNWTLGCCLGTPVCEDGEE